MNRRRDGERWDGKGRRKERKRERERGEKKGREELKDPVMHMERRKGGERGV